jgi:hypothetical protein
MRHVVPEASVLQHFRQIPASRTAWIIHIECNLLRAFGCQFIEPIDELGIAATLTNETGEDIAAIPPTLFAGDAQHIELTDEIAEEDCAVAGHHTSPDGLILGCTVLFQ